MGIKVMNQWVLRLPMEQADTALRVGLEQMGASPYGSLGRIEGKTKAALMRNRYGAKITVDLTEHPEGTLVEVLIDALGDKQQEMLDELAATLPAGVLDDHGITAEIEKLGKMSRLFGKRELSHLRRILNPEERVVALGQGTYEKLQSLIVLTDQRLVLLEKGIVRETVKEFQLSAISSLSLQKGWGGESLDFTASGAKGAITSMMPGQGGAVRRRLPPVAQCPCRQNGAAGCGVGGARRARSTRAAGEAARCRGAYRCRVRVEEG